MICDFIINLKNLMFWESDVILRITKSYAKFNDILVTSFHQE